MQMSKELELLKQKKLMQENLPHLYGYLHYKWSRKFFESKNRHCLLTAANQIGKSSTQIRKMIHWATSPDLWPELWPGRTPRIFWYLYPTTQVAKVEILKKWVQEFLPRGPMREHPQYGWKIEKERGIISAIHFNTGVSIYFKTYAQDVSHLQSSTVDYIATDEELPIDLFPELQARLIASRGYFSMVFTATLSQPEWQKAMECIGRRNEFLPTAHKQQVSMYDCLEYEDGSETPWNVERIKREENLCPTEAEVQRRIYGKFVKSSGLRYASFTRDRNHVVYETDPPHDWLIYAGIDYGSGGEKGHPSSIVFVAVRPDFQKARVFAGWRGDNEVTTAGDVVDKYLIMRDVVLKRRVTQAFYDYHCKDLYEIASRRGEAFTPADKGIDRGDAILNTLFKNKILDIDEKPELEALCEELESIPAERKKQQSGYKVGDDYVDALRYACALIQWNWNEIGYKPLQLSMTCEKSTEDTLSQDRREFALGLKNGTTVNEVLEDEINYWNSMYAN